MFRVQRRQHFNFQSIANAYNHNISFKFRKMMKKLTIIDFQTWYYFFHVITWWSRHQSTHIKSRWMRADSSIHIRNIWNGCVTAEWTTEFRGSVDLAAFLYADLCKYRPPDIWINCTAAWFMWKVNWIKFLRVWVSKMKYEICL